MNAANIYGQGISFPPRLGPDGRMAFSAGPDNIREAIEVTLMTSRGERLMLPDFGGSLRNFLFEPNTTATRRLVQEDIEKVLGVWEPRISIQSVDVNADPNDARAVVAVVQYQLVATQQSGQMSLQIQLGG
ncbi:MAG TPA: GPW/gp25 family protein [Candidatus Dormibacteraeota bacterium]|nr:GPW/gp25 family protein [Candidatus Dormibacteraeota bacterium]